MDGAVFLRRHWKLLLNIATFLALGALIYAIRDQLVVTFANLWKVKAWALLLLIPIEAMNYHAQAKLYQRLYAAAGDRVSYRGLLRVSLELNFINHVFPSGGVSGLSYFSLRMRQYGARATKSSLVQTMKLMLLFVSFELVLLIGMISLALHGRANSLVILLGCGITAMIIAGTAVFVFIIGSKQRIHRFLSGVVRAANRVMHIVRRAHPETIRVVAAQSVFDEFHDDYRLLTSSYSRLIAPLWWAFLANATEVAAVYAVYIAFGAFVNIGAVILAYAIANFAGVISVLPGGEGVFEALMTGVLVVAGVPIRLSLPVTIMYRVLNTLLQVPPGYALYHAALRRSGPAEVASGHILHE